LDDHFDEANAFRFALLQLHCLYRTKMRAMYFGRIQFAFNPILESCRYYGIRAVAAKDLQR
jgi:hypothetical protein